MYHITSPNSAFAPHVCSPFARLNTSRMIKCLRQCQQHCGGTAWVSRAVRFVLYLCQVVFIRAKMRPICRLGCQPSPSSQQVFCAVLCVTVSARLVLGEVADCFEFSQYTEHSSAQLRWTNACTHTETCTSLRAYTHVFMCACEKALAHTHTHFPFLKGCWQDGNLQVVRLSHLSLPDNGSVTHWSHTSCTDYNIASYYIPESLNMC